MLWLYIAIFSYLLTAISYIFDKYLLTHRIPKPFAYSFWVSILSSFCLVLIPFGVHVPDLKYFIFAFLSGTAFFVGLIYLYRAVKASDVFVSSTNVGGLTAVFTYLFSFLLLGSQLTMHVTLAFVVLVIGLFILGLNHKHIWGWVIVSGAAFGLSYVALKWALNVDLINGIFWTRIGFVGTGLFFLLIPSARKEILSSFKDSTHFSKFLFIFNKIVATLGFLALYLAIKLGEVSLVNGIIGLQFLFVFIIAFIFRHKIAGAAENFRHKVLIQRLAGLAFVIIGFLYLYLVI